MCIHPHTHLKTHTLSLRAMKHVNTAFKLKFLTSNHSTMTVNIQWWFALLKWLAVGKKRHRFIPHLTSSGSALEKHADNLWMIPAFRGEGLPGTCFISTTSFFLSPPSTPLHLLIPLSFLPQASLFKFPCCQPTLAKRHCLPVSWLNCWRCLLLLGNPLHPFVPSTETQLHNCLCKPDIPSASFLSFSSAFSLTI